MLAFKFLLEGAVGPFSQYAWPAPAPSGRAPAPWVTAAERPQRCAVGVHACAAEDLAYWLASELWIIELGGEILREEKKLVAERGRLVQRVEAWDAEVARAFAEACVLHARDAACALLRDAGGDALADALAACPDVAGIAALAGGSGGVGGDTRAGSALGYLADSIDPVEGDAALCAYITAHVPLSQEGYARERAWQSRWLVERLGLEQLIAPAT